jgi:hypothetical protein
MSRSFVGSSRIKKLDSEFKTVHKYKRFNSPPLNDPQNRIVFSIKENALVIATPKSFSFQTE